MLRRRPRRCDLNSLTHSFMGSDAFFVFCFVLFSFAPPFNPLKLSEKTRERERKCCRSITMGV